MKCRFYLIKILLFIVAGFSFSVFGQSITGWTVFRGDAEMSGKTNGELPTSPKVKWELDLAEEIESTAVIVKNTVFITTLEGNLHALTLETGKKKWTFSSDSEIKSSPAYKKGIIYFGNENGDFFAVNAITGKQLWTFAAEAEIISSANFFENTVIFGSYDQFIYSLDTKKGELKWKVETQNYVHSSPTVWRERIVIAGCDGWLRQINAQNGSEIDSLEMSGYVASTIAINNGFAYFGSFENTVFSVDLENNKILWSYEHPVRKFPFYASAAILEKIVILAGRDKLIHGIDRITGESVWTSELRAKIEASPLTDGKSVFAADSRGNMVIVNAETGKTAWTYQTNGKILASPAFSEGKLIISDVDGIIYCFE